MNTYETIVNERKREFAAWDRFAVWCRAIRTASESVWIHVTRDGVTTLCGRPVVAGSMTDMISGTATARVCRKGCRS